jgi:hypothetical protein
MRRCSGFAAITAVLSILVTASCGGVATSAPSPSSSSDAGADHEEAPPVPTPARVPTDHRSAAAPCTQPRGPGISANDAQHFTGECHADADCTAGKNGRCELQALAKLVCSYDECAADADCASGVCTCRNGAHDGANTCFRGNCVTDADCRGSYCSPSGTKITYNCMTTPEGPVPASSFGYFCHTASDACVDDADCGQEGACVFQTSLQKWACLKLLCTG